MKTESAHKSAHTQSNKQPCLLQNGTLKIVDRKKHIFKLAQGEYIAPEKIENIYIRSEAVSQAFVHGDSLQVTRETITLRWRHDSEMSVYYSLLSPLALSRPVWWPSLYLIQTICPAGPRREA